MRCNSARFTALIIKPNSKKCTFDSLYKIYILCDLLRSFIVSPVPTVPNFVYIIEEEEAEITASILEFRYLM